jgi:polysaccharide export outer membrane protein
MVRLTGTPALFLPLALALLQGCAMPQGAGMASQVMAGAEAPDADFDVRFVSAETLPVLGTWPRMADPNAIGSWIGHQDGPASTLIEAGDVLTVSVWSNEENALLGTPGQKQIAIPPLTVSPDGTVFLPYAGKVYVAKMTPDGAREAVEMALLAVMPTAQVQLSVESGRRNVVELISGVADPGPYPLPDRNYSVLSLLAAGGGASSALQNPQVRLMRDGRIHGIALETLLGDPALDTTLRGGDKVYVEGEERYFLSLGAAGKEAQNFFPQAEVSALDAMSLIGGLADASADPKGILVLRNYPATALRDGSAGPDKARTIFVFDLTTADGLFSAGQFEIAHRDLVLVTESPVVSTRTAISLFASAFGAANVAQSLQE